MARKTRHSNQKMPNVNLETQSDRTPLSTSHAQAVEQQSCDRTPSFRQRIHSLIWRVTRFHPLGVDLPLGYAIGWEICNLFERIKILRSNNLYQSGTDLGPSMVRDASGHLQPCKETHVRIRGTGYMQTKMPWASSPLDLHLFLEGVDFARREWQSAANCDVAK
ncbi:MAG: hypothetical protein JWO13_1369 [Acidobacteriales bacterium]|nr:hypothetical protein [Terriglobales bacterium]